MNHPASVVILDDEINVLKSLQRVFSDEPYGIFTTTQPQEALAYISTHVVKVIMSDQRMPQMSGVDFLSQARQIRPDAIRILFTGYTDIRSAEDAINKGQVYRFINKPWNDDELLLIIRDSVHRHDLGEENKLLHKKTLEQKEELLKKNIELKSAMDAQANFTSTISHELRTPLTSIKTGIELVQKGYCGAVNDKQAEYLNRVTKSVGRLNRLINDVLDISKMNSGQSTFKKESLDLRLLLEEVAANQKPVAEKKGLLLTCDPGNVPSFAEVDPDKIYQLLTNLVHNAIKFTEQGSVSMRIHTEADRIIIHIADTGVGIDPNDQSKIFKEFEQLGNSTQRVEGTGLGLAICKKIAEGHLGNIRVESQSGKGSLFIVELPSNGGSSHVR